MANTGFLSTSELDFNTLKQNLKTYLKGQSQFSDFDFDASNISVLLDILTYNTYMNSFYLNMIGSEMFMDTAQLKESVVSHAKELNYLPRSRTSSEAFVNITVDTGLDTPDNVVIPKNYRLATSVDNESYTFLVGEDTILISNNGIYASANTPVYEGILVTEYFNTVDSNSKYILRSGNVDTRSIDVYVATSNTSSTFYPYTYAESLYGLTSTSNAFFITGYGKDQYEVKFGNGSSGRALANGSFVKVQYRDTKGDAGNGAYKFSKTSSIAGYSGVSISTVATAANGSERETVDEIKFNAPRFFNTQERAVTKEDYITLVKAKFPEFQAVTAYGGEEMDPPRYGKVAIAVKPYGSIALIADSLKKDIVDYLTLKNLTTEPIVVDPDFFYASVNSSVKYNTKVTELSSGQLKAAVQQAILNFANTNVTNFGSDLSYSKLVSAIDASDVSILGNDTEVMITRRWVPPVQQSNTISFSFNNALYHENSLYSLPQGHELVIKSSVFNYVSSGNNTYNAYVGDDGLGNLKIYYDKTDSTTGIVNRITLEENAGSVNYYTGSTLVTANVYSYTGNHINITAKLSAKDVAISKNTFLLFSSDDINITMIAQTV